MAKKLAKLVRLDVVHYQRPREGTRQIKRRSVHGLCPVAPFDWNVLQGAAVVAFGCTTQARAVTVARKWAGELIFNGARGVTVRVHRRDGRVREERTYPRSADPRRSRG